MNTKSIHKSTSVCLWPRDGNLGTPVLKPQSSLGEALPVFISHFLEWPPRSLHPPHILGGISKIPSTSGGWSAIQPHHLSSSLSTPPPSHLYVPPCLPAPDHGLSLLPRPAISPMVFSIYLDAIQHLDSPSLQPPLPRDLPRDRLTY